MMELSRQGAKIKSGIGLYNRKFEPIDILIPLWRCIRLGKLPKNTEHITDKYFKIGIKPSESNTDYIIWKEIIIQLKPILINKDIIVGGNNE